MAKTFAPEAKRFAQAPQLSAPEPKCPPVLLAFPSEQAGILGTANRRIEACAPQQAGRIDVHFGPGQCAFSSALGPKVFENLVCVSTAGSTARSARA